MILSGINIINPRFNSMLYLEKEDGKKMSGAKKTNADLPPIPGKPPRHPNGSSMFH